MEETQKKKHYLTYVNPHRHAIIIRFDLIELTYGPATACPTHIQLKKTHSVQVPI